jgi:signal peptidase II
MFCLLTDQLSKLAVRLWINQENELQFFGEIFRIVHVENTAGVMGIGIIPMWVLSILSIGAVVLIAYWLWKMLPSKDWWALILPWVLGGALGNLIDRIMYRSVTDMFDVDIPDVNLPAFDWWIIHFDGFYLTRWWVFNVADSYIFLSMILLIFLSLSGRLDNDVTEK